MTISSDSATPNAKSPRRFKPRRYRHLDVPICPRFAEKVSESAFVERHSWLPLLKYEKNSRRYNPITKKTVVKVRPIMYASHRDAYIFEHYADILSDHLERHYEFTGLDRTVIAYRRLGRANYHFSLEAAIFAREHIPCVVLCFDIKGFFDNLDHKILKHRLRDILGNSQLTTDWYKAFRAITKYSSIELSSIRDHSLFGRRLKDKTAPLIGTIAEMIEAGIEPITNRNGHGIPQGTPISTALSNLYMIEIDRAMFVACTSVGALYRRYSDDMMIVCHADYEEEIVKTLHSAIDAHKLELQVSKSERVTFAKGADEAFQYLGFENSLLSSAVRSSSLAKQWRKARRKLRRLERIGLAAIARGKSNKIYTRSAYKQFSPIDRVRNFSLYARRSADAFNDRKILKQALRLERMVAQELKRIRSLKPTSTHGVPSS